MTKRKPQTFDDIFRLTRMLVRPRHALATFGPSTIEYCFLASLDKNRTRLREGQVLFQKPRIIVPHEVEELFEGFGGEVGEFIDDLYTEHRHELVMLGYRFTHAPRSAAVVADPFADVLNRVKERAQEQASLAVFSGSDNRHELSVLKFTLDMIIRSTAPNMTELAERGFFAPEDERRVAAVRREVEQLFTRAAQDRAALPALAAFLKEHNLFSAYEDRFFSLAAGGKS